MNLRHTSALALVGWYLMVRPSMENQQPDKNAAISWWRKSELFRSEQDCQDQLNKLRAGFRDPKFQATFQAKHGGRV
jgi:hypothetical protein